MADGTDARYMARALQLARRGLNTTDPNPRVGCVIVRDGQVVGEGWHERAGEAHAERHALNAAGAAAAGATVYLTLEPCAHQGRTPPCAPALIEAGVARVVCAMKDPNPRVAGRGMQTLQAAGIKVETGVGGGAAAALNRGFIQRMVHGRPLVRVKLAASLDGGTALANGNSQWITGAAARGDVQRWRARASAVLTGIGTVLADDPSLNARPPNGGECVQPVRVILDAALRLPLQARTLGLPGEVLVFTHSDDAEKAAALAARGATVISWPGSGALSLTEVFAELGRRDVNEVWVEAGARLSGALLADGLADELIIYLAPHLLGSAARGMFELGELTELSQRVQLRWQAVRRVGNDLRLHLRPVRTAQADDEG